MPRKPRAAAATLDPDAVLTPDLLEKFRDFPGIKAVMRRMESPDHDPGSVDIRLIDEPDYAQDPRGLKRLWHLRWVNGGQEGRFANITQVKGYVPVRVHELQNQDLVAGLFRRTEDGDHPIVRRGDRGQEVLCKMPLELYQGIRTRQQEIRARRARNAKLVKEDLAHANAREFGDQAADMVYDDFSLTVKRSRTTIGDELGKIDEDDQA